jgi:hypothetical protein
MPGIEMKRPASVVALVVLELFFAILGIISGLILMLDPSGAGLGFGSDILEQIPFHSFLPVGLFLFVIYGLGSLVIAYGSWTRRGAPLLVVSKRFGFHWAWVGGMAQMGVLLIWLAVEGVLIGLDFPATYFTVVIGVAIFATLIMPSTRRYFKLIKT